MYRVTGRWNNHSSVGIRRKNIPYSHKSANCSHWWQPDCKQDTQRHLGNNALPQKWRVLLDKILMCSCLKFSKEGRLDFSRSHNSYSFLHETNPTLGPLTLHHGWGETHSAFHFTKELLADNVFPREGEAFSSLE